MTQPKIYVAGHQGMVGSAIVRALNQQGQTNIVTRTHAELELTNQAAARVGGIHANNTYPAEFIFENLMVEANVIHHAWCAGVKKLLFLGSSCIYPKLVPQPMREDALLTAPMEPTNLYGPGGNYHPENSHVIPAMLRRFHEAKVSKAPSVTIWGTGTPLREFRYVDDMAALPACM